MNIADFRKPEQSDVDPLFVRRWSPRAMSGEDIPDQTLKTLFEAARWAPSSNNNQPWRFIYAHRMSPDWDRIFDLMTVENQAWTKNAGVLIVVISKTTFDSGKPARTHTFDAGAAWMSFALQGSLMDLVIHGMQGFDYDKAKEVLHVPADYQVEAMIAVGKHGKKEVLPDYQQEREFPKSRKSLADIAMEAVFRPTSGAC